MSKYNEVVRQKISDRLISASNERARFVRERDSIADAISLPDVKHSDYVGGEIQIRALTERIKELEIEIRVWDAARDICLDTSDELKWRGA